MKPTKRDTGFKAHGRFALLVLLALTLAACKPQSYEPASDAARPPSFSVTPPIPADPNDLFEDATAKAKIDFVQQFCDDRIANILESNGSGVVVFDYDNDGYMDLYFVNPGPLPGVTHEPPGTRRQPNRLFHNNGDGTFTDVTEKAGVGGAGAKAERVGAPSGDRLAAVTHHQPSAERDCNDGARSRSQQGEPQRSVAKMQRCLDRGNARYPARNHQPVDQEHRHRAP